MANPIQSFFDDAKQTLVFVISIILIIFVLGFIGVTFGMQGFTNNLISSMSLGVILILAIPPVGLVIGIVLLIKNSDREVRI